MWSVWAVVQGNPHPQVSSRGCRLFWFPVWWLNARLPVYWNLSGERKSEVSSQLSDVNFYLNSPFSVWDSHPQHACLLLSREYTSSLWWRDRLLVTKNIDRVCFLNKLPAGLLLFKAPSGPLPKIAVLPIFWALWGLCSVNGVALVLPHHRFRVQCSPNCWVRHCLPTYFWAFDILLL